MQPATNKYCYHTGHRNFPGPEPHVFFLGFTHFLIVLGHHHIYKIKIKSGKFLGLPRATPWLYKASRLHESYVYLKVT